MWIFESKHGHESTFYWTDFDDFGVVGKLALSAVERRQNHHPPTNIDALCGNVLIWGHFDAQITKMLQKMQIFRSKKIHRK